ncbi:MAG: rRNA maturation RNase YbeY [Actinomycetes bacterium]
MSLDLVNDSATEVEEPRLLMLAEFLWQRLEIDPIADLAIRLVDETEMTRLHVQFMDLAGPTDVLSFPMDDGPDPDDPQGGWVLGDIAICPAIAAAQGAAAGHSAQAELELLLTHGLLHLLGHDHAEPEEHAEMFGLQADLLAAWQTASQLGQS